MPNPQDIDGFDARMGWTGWPEWEHEDKHYRFRFRDLRTRNNAPVCEVLACGSWRIDGVLTDHEAACIIERHWREWLAERRYQVGQTQPPRCGGKWEYSLFNKQGTWQITQTGFPTHHAAQAAAIDAVMKEKGENHEA